jgi:ABC-type arginine/histidine transport system permease subunit
VTFYLTPNDIGVRVMVFNATVNNISVTVMDLLQVTDMLYHKIYQAYLAMVAQADVNATTIRSLL